MGFLVYQHQIISILGRVEALISSETETLVKIGATVIKSDDNIRRYSKEKVLNMSKKTVLSHIWLSN